MVWGEIKTVDKRKILSKQEYDALIGSIDRPDLSLALETMFESCSRVGEIVGNRLSKCRYCGLQYHKTRAVVKGKDKGKNVWGTQYVSSCPRCKIGSPNWTIRGGLRPIDVKKELNEQGETVYYLRIFPEKKRRTGKDQQDIKYISPALYDKLQAYIAAKGIQPEQRIFKLSRNRVFALLKGYAAKAEPLTEKKVHPHTLRHAGISFLMKHAALEDLPLITLQAGHSDPRLTMAYYDTTEEKRQKFHNRIFKGGEG